MDSESSRRAQKRTHPLMNLYLEVRAGGIFTVDREDISSVGFDSVRVDFEGMLLHTARMGEGGRNTEDLGYTRSI